MTRGRLLIRLPQLALAVAAIALMARTEGFFEARNLGSILGLASLVGVLAVGQAFTLIGGGFDLSQGAIVALAAAVSATLVERGFGPSIAGASAIATGAALGAINGLFVAAVRTNPFVTTLSTMLIYRGAAFVVLAGEQISDVRAFEALGREWSVLGVPVSGLGLIFVGLVALAWVALRQTVFGQYVYAVGGNAEASRLAGVRVGRVRWATFAISGAASGLAALMLLAFVRVAKADSGSGYELQSIAACVVGGVSLQGGAGSVLGAAAGCLLLQALANLINLSNFPDEYSTLITGLVILGFASLDRLARPDR